MYKDILYIDENSANDKKKNYIAVFLTTGQTIYLSKDRKNILFDCLKKYCKNTISKEEMIKNGFIK